MTFITSNITALIARFLLVAMFVASGITLMPAQSANAVTVSTAKISSDCKKTVLAVGSTGKCVKQLQQALVDAGKTIGPKGVTGTFQDGTRAGLISLQKERRLIVDGVAGSQVWKSLSKKVAVAAPPPLDSKCTNTVIRYGTSGECTKKLQKQLIKRGMWLGPSGADGSAGLITHNAIGRLQKLEGLTSDNLAGPETWSELVNGKPKISHLPESCFTTGQSLCVDISDKVTYAFSDGQLVKMMPSRTGGWFKFEGKWEHRTTPTGTFSVLFNKEKDSSSIYDNVKMFNSRYFTWKGHAVHGSESFTLYGNYKTPKGAAGSGGCVNLTIKDSRWLWNEMPNLKRVVVNK